MPKIDLWLSQNLIIQKKSETMPNEHSTTTLNDAIPGSLATDFIDSLQHQRSRLVIKEVVQEFIDSSALAQRVQGIILDALEADPAREKLKQWTTDIAKTEVNNCVSSKRDKNWNHIIGIGGVIIGVVGVIVAIVALFVKNG